MHFTALCSSCPSSWCPSGFSSSPAFSVAAASGFTIAPRPINCYNNDSALPAFDWIVPECGSFEFTQAASDILLAEPGSGCVSDRTSRARREWIPAQSFWDKRGYLGEGGEVVIDTRQRASEQTSSLDFCYAPNLFLPRSFSASLSAWFFQRGSETTAALC